MEIKHAKTRAILEAFEQVNQIPRGSKNEKAISDWLVNWAKENGFESDRDEVLNVVIRVPGTAGFEKSPTVVIQGHMDMVCEKAKGVSHDFTKDPIKSMFVDGWLTADGTTLGSDNGIAIAMAMVASTADDVAHPPLELLFTVDEETGLTGANFLKPGFIKGKILLNIDSEDEGVFTVGCAGGRDTHIHLPIVREAAPAGHQAFKVVVEGLRGGHSGIDIQKERGNALRVLGRALHAVSRDGDMRLCCMSGGSAHNAIPRDAEAVVFLAAGAADGAKQRLAELGAALKQELANTDAGVKVLLEAGSDCDAGSAWSKACTQQAVDLLFAIPHGVEAWSTDIHGLVETSNNLATVKMGDDTVTYQTSQRSSLATRLNALTWRVEATGRLAGAKVESGEGYPAWPANMDSPLLARCKRIYQETFGKEPVVEIIHAGLECGIIGDRNPGMDMISFGPTIEGPHSPDERINVETIGQVWDLLAAILKSFK